MLKRWTAEEDAIIEAVYPHYPASVLFDLLPDRSNGAIQQRIYALYVHKAPKAQRSTVAPSVLAEAARKRAGTPYEHPVIAGMPAGRRVVPLEILPSNAARNSKELHVWYPEDPETLRACAAICSFLSSDGKSVQQAGPEAQHFFASQAEFLRQRADRAESKALA